MDELEHQQKELEALASPIMTRLYQQGGAGGGGMPGGMPDMGAAGGASSPPRGPTVEEVD